MVIFRNQKKITRCVFLDWLSRRDLTCVRGEEKKLVQSSLKSFSHTLMQLYFLFRKAVIIMGSWEWYVRAEKQNATAAFFPEGDKWTILIFIALLTLSNMWQTGFVGNWQVVNENHGTHFKALFLPSVATCSHKTFQLILSNNFQCKNTQCPYLNHESLFFLMTRPSRAHTGMGKSKDRSFVHIPAGHLFTAVKVLHGKREREREHHFFLNAPFSCMHSPRTESELRASERLCWIMHARSGFIQYTGKREEGLLLFFRPNCHRLYVWRELLTVSENIPVEISSAFVRKKTGIWLERASLAKPANTKYRTIHSSITLNLTLGMQKNNIYWWRSTVDRTNKHESAAQTHIIKHY